MNRLQVEHFANELDQHLVEFHKVGEMLGRVDASINMNLGDSSERVKMLEYKTHAAESYSKAEQTTLAFARSSSIDTAVALVRRIRAALQWHDKVLEQIAHYEVAQLTAADQPDGQEERARLEDELTRLRKEAAQAFARAEAMVPNRPVLVHA